MSKELIISGKQYWRSLDQLADTPEFRKFLENEFPDSLDEVRDPVSRRKFLTLMGASLSLAGLIGCRKPVEKVIPYVIQPEEITPGIPQYYATTMPFGSDAYGVLVESHEGRPTKIEGNPGHPATMGRSNAFIQASILGLYDPDRSSTVLEKGEERTWNDFISFWNSRYSEFIGSRGEGLAVFGGQFTSPTLARLKERFLSRFPNARWVTYEPVSDENITEGIRLATGRTLQPVYNFDNAKVILSLDSDFLNLESNNIANTAGFSEGRQLQSEEDEMNRLYMAESSYSVTGSMADHRIRLKNSQISSFAAAISRELGSMGVVVEGASNIDFNLSDASITKFVSPIALDLAGSRGECVVIAGRDQSPYVHALVFAINEALENNGTTINYLETEDRSLSDTNGLLELVGAINEGSVNTLMMIDTNPVYNCPANLEFRNLMEKVDHTIHFGLYMDETGVLSEWHIPLAHYLESWGDARSADGTMSVIQPLIEPLFGGKDLVKIFNLIANGNDGRSYDIVRGTWRRWLSESNFENEWKRILHDGVLPDSRSGNVRVRTDTASLRRLFGTYPQAETGGIELVFKPSPATFDGRFANNGWLQELPDPLTKLTWDNAALISPATAEELGFKNNDLLSLSSGDWSIDIPTWILPGAADNSITVDLGYGRESAGRIASSAGFNTYKLRTSFSPWVISGVEVIITGSKYDLASTQDHWSLDGRPIVREAGILEYKDHPEFAKEMVEHPPLKSMWKDHKYDEGYQWGMAIDLSLCNGCNACVVACQSENNIPVVGREEVEKGREMHWIRIDRYFSGAEGNTSDPGVLYQPMGCQHCEMAPCEQVCPVAATVHDKEGLNNMVYNRCIGTRYCSNNCPFKVRRFNFFNFTKDTPEVQKMANNPDVTVRSRGVMEKCTYCQQRLTRAKYTAKLENRELRDGEVMSACQQACPAGAIVFGNINDPDSRISKIKQQNRDYRVLEELNIRPRTSYLAKIRNPNPEID